MKKIDFYRTKIERKFQEKEIFFGRNEVEKFVENTSKFAKHLKKIKNFLRSFSRIWFNENFDGNLQILP